MSESFKSALKDYDDAMRMFNYASAPDEIDVAIMLLRAADIKLKALKNINNSVYKLEPISEVY